MKVLPAQSVRWRLVLKEEVSCSIREALSYIMRFTSYALLSRLAPEAKCYLLGLYVDLSAKPVPQSKTFCRSLLGRMLFIIMKITAG